MRMITSSGTLTDTIFPGHTFEVVFCIQIFDPGFQTLASVDYVLRKDGQETANGQYDLRDSLSGDSFHLRKTASGWEVDVGGTSALNLHRAAN